MQPQRVARLIAATINKAELSFPYAVDVPAVEIRSNLAWQSQSARMATRTGVCAIYTHRQAYDY